MLSRICRYAIVTLALWAMPMPEAAAQDFSLTFYGGFENPGKLTLHNVESGFDGTAIAGVRFEWDFLRIVGMEQTFAVAPDFAAPHAFESIKSGKGFFYNDNLVVNLPIGHFVPYATAGLGLVHSGRIFGLFEGGSLVPQEEFGTRFAVNYGGGIKLMNLAGPLGARFDVRGYTLPDVFSDTLNLFEVSGGLMLSF